MKTLPCHKLIGKQWYATDGIEWYEMQTGWAYCPVCGEKLPEATGTSATNTTLASASVVEPVTGEEHMCPNCLSDDTSRCMDQRGRIYGVCHSCRYDWLIKEGPNDRTS